MRQLMLASRAIMAVLPRISIVTPSFQQAAYLEECLASVRDQGYPALEHVVVDGGSTDGSVGIIERHASGLAWWCSEADRGQSHAINKGWAHCTGEVLGWVNSDDALVPGALQKVGEAFAADPDLIVLTGVRLCREAGQPDAPMPMEEPVDTRKWFTEPRINQQATFFRASAIRAVQGVEEGLAYVMDYELWLQLLFRFGTGGVRVVPWHLGVFRHHGASKTALQQARFVDETASVLHGLCLATGLHHHAEALAIGHRLTTPLRHLPVAPEQAGLVDAMVNRFMLKWHHRIHTREEYRMMRHWRGRRDAIPGLDDAFAERLLALDDALRAPTWLLFRVRRKLKHLFA
jgi:hypothetical protein